MENIEAPVSRSSRLANFAEGSPARQMVNALIAARLLVADQSGAEPTVRLAHEALIGRWGRAKEQLAADRRDLEIRTLVEEQFKRWRNEHYPARRLLQNPDLANAIDLAKRWGDELEASVRDYIKRSARRARLAQTVIAGAALLFFFVAVVAVFEGTRAKDAEQEAETNYRLAIDQAAGSADTLNRGFIEGAINSRLMAELVARGQETVNKLPAHSDEVTAARAKLLIAMSPAVIAVGEIGKAREYADAATKIVEGLLRTDPNRFEWRRLWAESQAAIGVAIFWAGDDADTARAKSLAAIAEFKRLAETAPGNTLIDEKLIACYENLGDAARSLGDFPGATAAYTEWLNLANILADRASDQVQARFWRSYAADAHLRLGDASQQQKKYDTEAEEYRAGVAIASRLNADEPSNAKFLEHLSLGHGKLGEALIASNKFAEATKEIDLNISLTDSLVKDLSANIRWLLYQEWSHLRKGRLFIALKRYDEAYSELTMYLHGVEGMRKRDPGYISALYDAANAHQWIGDVLRLQHKLDDAGREYIESLHLALETVQKSPPTNQAAKKILALAYQRIGLIQELQGRWETAAANYRNCVATNFNRNTWTPRSNWPDDVTEICQTKLEQLGRGLPP